VQIKAVSVQHLGDLEALRRERKFFGDVLLGAARDRDCAVGEAATSGWRRSAATPRSAFSTEDSPRMTLMARMGIRFGFPI
jgi:hypothetical protein